MRSWYYQATSTCRFLWKSSRGHSLLIDTGPCPSFLHAPEEKLSPCKRQQLTAPSQQQEPVWRTQSQELERTQGLDLPTLEGSQAGCVWGGIDPSDVNLDETCLG